jgi:hypothetical protein
VKPLVGFKQKNDLLYILKGLLSCTVEKGLVRKDGTEGKSSVTKSLQYFRFLMQHKKMSVKAVFGR